MSSARKTSGGKKKYRESNVFYPLECTYICIYIYIYTCKRASGLKSRTHIRGRLQCGYRYSLGWNFLLTHTHRHTHVRDMHQAFPKHSGKYLVHITPPGLCCSTFYIWQWSVKRTFRWTIYIIIECARSNYIIKVLFSAIFFVKN